MHNGHLRVAIEAVERLGLACVRLLPLNQPNHREPAEASPGDRLDMLEAAARPPLVVDPSEIERGGVSYTVDTLEHERERFPGRSLCLLLGLDSYLTLPSWHRPERVLELAHIVVAARPGIAAAADPGLDALVENAQSERVSDLHAKPAGHVLFLDIPLLPIASSDLRERLRAGRSVRYLVPDCVERIIHERGLYRA